MKHLTVALVIAHNGYQSKEYNDTKNELLQAHITVITVSNKAGHATASNGSQTPVDIVLENLDCTKVDGFFLIGGPGTLENLDTPFMHQILQKIRALKIPYGGICIAPRILAKADVLQGMNATGWDEDNKLTEIFEIYGINYAHTEIVVDGPVVTACGPHAAREFGQALIKVVKHAASGDYIDK